VGFFMTQNQQTDQRIEDPKFICDCGQIYTERAAVRECQAANHSAAAGCELADAERALRDIGIDPYELTPDELKAIVEWEREQVRG
jgi:hypothetical protein